MVLQMKTDFTFLFLTFRRFSLQTLTGFQLCGSAYFDETPLSVELFLDTTDLRVPLLQIGGNSKLRASGANCQAISHSGGLGQR